MRVVVAASLSVGMVGCRLPDGASWEPVSRDAGSGEGLATARPGSGGGGPMIEKGGLMRAPAVPGASGGFGAGEWAASAPRPEIAVSAVASPVPNLRGYVFTPHLGERKMVDVRRFSAGQEVLCPYTYRSFVVPDFDLGGGGFGENVATMGVVGSSSGGGVDGSSWAQLASNRTDVPVIRMDGEELARRMEESAADADRSARRSRSEQEDAEMPVGRWVAGRPGFVYSPFASESQLVDVTAVEPGTVVVCPYTGRKFRLPGGAPGGDGGAADGEGEGEAKREDAAGEEGGTDLAPRPQEKPVPDAGGEVEEPGSADAPKKPEDAGDDLPTAERVAGRPGLVQSPFGRPGQLVDVTGKASGEIVACPFTYRRFRVP